MNAFSRKTEFQMVTFFLDGKEYGVDVMQVREIVSMTAITKTVNAPHHVEGVINLRGKVIPVISLRKYFGLSPLDDEEMSFIAIMNCDGNLTGFIIDEVSEVSRVQSSELLPPPDTTGQPWMEGVLNRTAGMVVLMNLQALVKE